MNSTDIDQKQSGLSFYRTAEVTKTMRPFDPGTKKYRHKAAVMAGSGKLVKVRRYKGDGGVCRVTVEVEV